MRTEMCLTIQDYINRRSHAGMQSKAYTKTKSDSGSGNSPFSRALAATHAFPEQDRQGLSIQDYLQRRVNSHRVVATSKADPVLPLRLPPPVSSIEPPVGHENLLDTKTPIMAPEIIQESKYNSQSQEHRKILVSIDQAATRYKLPPALIKAVVKTESDFQVRAISPVGAQGLMQLMPGTARELGVTDPFDIDQNIQGGAQYLRRMLDQFNGDVHLALTAYNAGPGTVARYNGKVPYIETRNYVQRVMRYAEEFSAPTVT
jgi:hypothetical protein